MKRIALLGFIVFVVPVWIVSCHKDDCNVSVKDWTFSELTINITTKMDGVPVIQNDTIKTDSIYFRSQVIQSLIANLRKNQNSSYFSFACPPSTDIQQNSISNVVFGILEGSKIDSSISSSLKLELKNYDEFNWVNDKKKFIGRMSMYYFTHDETILLGKFLNPHSSKPVQIIMMAIKENGDTLKAISQEVFLK